MPILAGPSANPYTECSRCPNLCLPGELEHMPTIGIDVYLCEGCRVTAEEKQAEQWEAEHYGD